MERNEPRLAALLLTVTCAYDLPAQAPQLVLDINTRVRSTPSDPAPGAYVSPRIRAQFVTLLGETYFVAHRPDVGLELFATRGTAASTRLVADVYPGPDGAQPRDLTVVGLKLFFVARTPFSRSEVFVFEPLVGGVRQVSTSVSSDGLRPRYLTAFGRNLVFQARDRGDNAELWHSDGTRKGTGLLKEILAGPRGSKPRNFVLYGQRMFFFANDGSRAGLYATDGTLAGTTRVGTTTVAPVAPGMAVYRGLLYFVATTAAHGEELWCSDGTGAGTRLLFDLWPGSTGSTPEQLTVARGRLFFSACGYDAAQGVTSGRELYETDGRALRLHELAAGVASSDPLELTPAGKGGRERLFFVAGSPRTGREVFVCDDRGVHCLDFTPGRMGTEPRGLLAGPRGAVYFSGLESRTARELYRTDGSLTGTWLVQKIDLYRRRAGAGVAFVSRMYGGDLLFAADDGPHGMELWRSDGTAHGTRLVADIHVGSPGTRSSQPVVREVVNGLAYFTASADERAPQLWRTDGTRAGTLPVLPLVQHQVTGIGAVHGYGQQLLVVGMGQNRAGDSTGSELWALDGAGDVTLIDLARGEHSSYPDGFTSFRGLVYFAADGDLNLGGRSGLELWRTDGTIAGTSLVKDLLPGAQNGAPRSGTPAQLTVVGAQMFFTAMHPTNGEELWRTDGTPAGTHVVYDIAPGAMGSRPSDLTALGDRLVFVAENQARGRELWVTDGTRTGTRCLELRSGAFGGFSSYATAGARHGLMRVGGRIYFPAMGTLHGAGGDVGTELWSTDGTLAGTRLVADVRPGPFSSVPSGITALGLAGDFVFIADTGTGGTYSPALFRSDGTARGTRLLRAVSGGWDVRLPSVSGRIGTRHAAFQVPRQGSGVQPHDLLITDGTTAGTRTFVANVSGASYNQSDRHLMPSVGGRVLVPRDEPRFGEELWVVDDLALAEPVGTPCAAGGRQPRLVVEDPAGARVHPSLEGAAPDTFGVLAISGRRASWGFAGRCELHVDPYGPLVLRALQTDSLGRWHGILATMGAVRHFQYATQAILHDVRTGSTAATNGVVLTMGR